MPSLTKSLLLTRTEIGNKQLAKQLHSVNENIKLVYGSLFEIQNRKIHPKMDGIKALIFTSKNAVFASKALKIGAKIPVYCVGKSTAEIAKKYGFLALSSDGNSLDLIEFIKKNFKPDNGSMLYLRGEDIAFNTAEVLRESGYTILEYVCYRQRRLKLENHILEKISKEVIGSAVFFSPNSARFFAEEVQKLPDHFVAFCMSKTVAKTLKSGLPNTKIVYKVPKAPNFADMCKLIIRSYGI